MISKIPTHSPTSVPVVLTLIHVHLNPSQALPGQKPQKCPTWPELLETSFLSKISMLFKVYCHSLLPQFLQTRPQLGLQSQSWSVTLSHNLKKFLENQEWMFEENSRTDSLMSHFETLSKQLFHWYFNFPCFFSKYKNNHRTHRKANIYIT